ncbi:MAG: hypothetical protein IH991_24505 [Planctomycetes bacterium]|nr:hypothetical protein [Planctomycetota bacterium]
MPSTRDFDLRKLNSATKYPSIPTYHALGERGILLDEHVSFDGQEVLATEKVDGTNSRIILMPDGCYLIGSREELLYAKGDLIHNPALGIVDAIKGVAERFQSVFSTPDGVITTVHLETYGGKTTSGAKQYTSRREFGYRMFDLSEIAVSDTNGELEQISRWREAGGQQFAEEDRLVNFAAMATLKLTPRIIPDAEIPTSIEATHQWLKRQIPKTLVALDDEAGGRPEGLVVRTKDRSTIAKIRLEDYGRHEKRTAKRN